MPTNERALVVLSGGQDSTTCLLWGLEKFDKVRAVSFDYGQRHGVELDAARAIALELGVEHKTLDLRILPQLGRNALVDDDEVIVDGDGDDLPSTFVPGRNLLFLTTAAAMAVNLGYEHVVTGVCQTDFSGYPDCRDSTICALELACRLGMEGAQQHDGDAVRIHTPLMYLTKAETWKLADDLGAVEFVREKTHTCYEGERDELHVWGYGCGECPACNIRRRGWEEFNG